ncbi:uncharacterized protein LOC121199914 [Toxotes jaculatrix]|uniref:uncharacterized protein LOC121199914 n=1 Tax=Toxotes jaculatrix TaxID=941984 RepID=UPI001B3A925A|nr:uncharacterized protein LOC121199914 [Toxotes jaculatrix]
MDSGDGCSLKDNKKMDANTVWQWRIMHVKKYSTSPELFHSSKKIGLDFNVGSNIQKKVDLHLVTNGVLLEVCDFAKTVIKGKWQFITNILENNFDLGLKNEQQRMKFTARILHKVKDLIQKHPKDKHEAFSLFDTSSETECGSNSEHGPSMASTEHKTNSVLVDMDGTVERQHEDVKCSQEPKTEEMAGPHVDDNDTEDEFECSGPQSTEELKEDVLPLSFPCCEEIGLSLDVDSTQSLDPSLLTKGVMLELVHFSRVLTASYRSLVLSVLEHNFELDLKSQQGKSEVWFRVLDLLKRREQLIAEFNSEPLCFQTARSKGGAPQYQFKEVTERRQCDLESKQEKRALSTTSERITKRCRREQAETNVHSQHTDLCTSESAKDDHHYMCPLDPDEVTDSENAESEDDSQKPPKECDMEQEIMETESNIWKLRANLVKRTQILIDKEYRLFKGLKKFGLEFDVGFGPKQNFSIDSLNNRTLLEVANFALSMSSSQQDTIIEILEYNFDIGLCSESQRKAFACEVMNRVRQLKNSEDAVKFSKQVFELPGLVSSVNRTNQTVDSDSPELSSNSRTEECDIIPPRSSDSPDETKEHGVDLYPFCKEIGLKLHVNNSQPNKKLAINKLTNGAMTEVTNFAEKLCGTFEEICLDILRHNFDFDCQREDSELAKTILARIHVIMEQRNRLTCLSSSQRVRHSNGLSAIVEVDCQNNPHSDACSTGSFQGPITDQNVGSSAETEQLKNLDLWLWKLRTKQIQQILSVPHVEHCPFYSYSRCKKLGMDFNVGSGLKLHLDPNLLTNGIMVELNTFATALLSSQKYFITEILEYNFHLDLNNEFYRSAFAQLVLDKSRARSLKCNKPRMLQMPFELPDSRCVEESIYLKAKYCPKCYQDRNDKLHQGESDPGHMLHPRPDSMTSTHETPNDVSSAFHATEEKITNSYRRCKKIGLSLCVDKEHPKDKLDLHVLTRGAIKEVAFFARRLCGTRTKIINGILEHNFSFDMQNPDINPAVHFRRIVALLDKTPTWFDDVFVVQPCSPRDASKLKKVSAVEINERKETTKKRMLALQTKKEQAMVAASVKSTKNKRSGICTPLCTEIGLDLEVKSESGDKDKTKKKLDLALLTRGVVMEIYKFVTGKSGQYFPGVVYDILDYNFDLSSQHYRRWEFSIAIASEVKKMVKHHRKNLHRANDIFKLPMVFERKASKGLESKRKYVKRSYSSVEETDKTTAEGSTVAEQVRHHSGVSHVFLLDEVKPNEKLWFEDEDSKPPTVHGALMQMTESPMSAGCDKLLQGNIRIKEEEDDPHYGIIKPEPDSEEKYYPHHYEDVKYLVHGEHVESLGYTMVTIGPNSESTINRESETENVQYYNLNEPQVPEGYAMLAVCPNTESGVKTESYSEGIKYVVPYEAAGSPEYSMITVCQDTESTSIKEEPVESYHYGVVSHREGEVDRFLMN